MIRYLTILALLACSALGADRYVATTGSDAATGTFELPWRSIGHGLRTMDAGDTLHVRGGTYTEATLNDWIKSGPSAAQPTRLKNYNGESVTVRSTGTTASTAILLRINQKQNVWVEGILWDASDGPTTGLFYIAHFRSITNAVITNNIFANVPKLSAVMFGPNGVGVGNSNVTFINNTITNWGYATALNDVYTDHALYVNSTIDSRFAGNTATNKLQVKTGHVWHFYRETDTTWGGCSNIIFENNFSMGHEVAYAISQVTNSVFRNNIDVVLGSPTAAWRANYFANSGVTFDNNTTYGGNYGFSLGHATSARKQVGMIFRNNIWWGNGAGGIIISPTVTDVTYWTNNIARSITDGSTRAVLSGNLFGTQYDPQFTDAPNDLTWGESSAARNRGFDLSSLFAVDYFGTVRPQESVFDIGAYEYDAGGTLPTVNIVSTGPALESGLVPASFTITRTESNVGALTVYLTKSGTAVAGVNYVAFADEVTILDGEWSVTVYVIPLEVAGYTGDVELVLTLAADAAYTIIEPSDTTITIAESARPTIDLGAKPNEPGRTYQSPRRR